MIAFARRTARRWFATADSTVPDASSPVGMGRVGGSRLATALRVAIRRGATVAVSPFDHPLLFGALSGGWLLAAWHLFAATFGWSFPATATALAVIAAAIDLGLLRTARIPSERTAAMMSVVLAGWTGCLPLVIVGLTAGLGRAPLEVLNAGWSSAIVHGLAALAVFGVPGWLTGRLAALAAARAQETMDSPAGLARFVTGVAVGPAATLFALAPWIGVWQSGTALTATAAAWRLVGLLSRKAISSTAAAPSLPNDTLQPRSLDRYGLRVGRSAIALLAIGVCLAIAGRATRQLTPATAFVVHTGWLAAALGAGWTFARSKRRREQVADSPSPFVGGLLAAGWTTTLLAAFPLLIDLCLAVSASISATWLQLSIRILIAALIHCPIGAGLGVCLASGRSVRSFPFGLTLVACGLVTGTTAIASGASMGVVAALILASFGVTHVVRCARTKAWPQTWGRRGLAAGLAGGLAAVAVLAPDYDPARSARLLFSTNVFAARQMGVERRLLAALDETRLAAIREGATGTVTMWKARGAQVLFRVDGVPRGIASCDPAITPQNAADLLPAVLPLAMHEAPGRVLVLGAGGGVPVQAPLACPVTEVVCVESDGAVSQLLREAVWSGGGVNPFDDDRLRLYTVDPATAIRCDSSEWDVIVSSPRLSALASASGEHTAEFYSNAARRLADDGLFCQRFSHADYGPGPILSVARTLGTAFAEVAALETGPGEMLFLATNSKAGLVRAGLVERLQRPHIRALLAQAGLDWTVPLNLAAVNPGSLGKLAAIGEVNSAAASPLTFRLPGELLRAAPKWQEVARTFQPEASKLLASPSIDANDPDLLGRLAEVAGQRNLMTSFPDQPWAYRKTLREHLTQSKRSVIQQVAGTGLDRALHPDDQHRVDYFEALGRAGRAENPKTEDIESLAGLASPYDPLVSYFIHFELSRLYERQSPPDRAAELRHRLHMAWYADPRDRSVRGVARALSILNEGGANLDPHDQWDLTNGLLQQLAARWGNRGMAKPISVQVALNDIELSLAAGEDALESLKRLAPSAGMSAAEVDARRIVVERSLIRPLRTYRTRLLPQKFAADQQARDKGD